MTINQQQRKLTPQKQKKEAPVIIDTKDNFGRLERTYSDGATEIISCRRGVTARRKEKAYGIYEYEITSDKGRFFTDNTNPKVSKANVTFNNNSKFKEASIEYYRKENQSSGSSILINMKKATTKANDGTVYTLEREENRYGQKTGMFIYSQKGPKQPEKKEKISEDILLKSLERPENRYFSGLRFEGGSVLFFFPREMHKMIDQ